MHRLLLLLLAIPVRCASPYDLERAPPIRDVQVIPEVDDSFIKRIPARIGSPEQDIVIMPWAIRRGGLYEETEPDTFQKASDVGDAGGSTNEATFQGSEVDIKKLVSTSLGGTDNLTVEGSWSLEEFPIGIPRLKWDAGYTLLHPLGLGSNSTYLNALRAAEKVSSRVWSIFWGRMWVKDPIDGSLVLGGYDEEKVIGKNYTAPLVYDDYTGTGGCWTGMKVTVSDIRVNFRDGSDKSIFPSNTALPCCLVPQRQLLLEAPGSYVDKFEQETGFNHTDTSYGIHWSARLFGADKVFDGDITFHLNSGLQVRVPNDQYIVPFVDIDRNGSRITKPNVRELLMSAVGSQPATLGRYFLTAEYLMVNHDAGTFTLWQANPSNSNKLVRVFSEETAEKCGGEASGVVQPSATTAPEEGQESDKAETTQEPEASSSPSGAVIGGAVAGAVVGMALIGLGIFYFLRGRRNAAPAAVTTVAARMPDGKYKIQGSHPMPPEMQGQSHFVYEMDGTAGVTSQGQMIER
ncbi:aspartic peptidase domain-containing protein [Thelonectria olida]|uniref:Aspartic peptidase domain-containing protein n=1 Tax=Thelonectria olida TaxID=1576542 RepID=A0A9P8VPG5_9HYPO|nr:aspartic peptidase domain-containing protein [Thelonectria olida]